MKRIPGKKNKNIPYIIGIVAVSIVLVCGIVLLVQYWQFQKELEQNLVRLGDLAVKITFQPEGGAGTDSEEKDTEGNVSLRPMHDFDALKQVNEDAYAWIQVPGTQVDYPILQSDTDNKYLDTNIDGSSGYPGCIYSNVCNSEGFDDYITVLYGHNMKTGEMFGSLHNFEEEDFFEAFETYTVETQEARFLYSVYAAVNYNDSLIPAYYDVKSAAGRDEFLESLEKCRGNSLTHFKDEIEISGEDKILVLSVCISGQADRRFLIVSKLEDRIEYLP